MKKIFKSMVWLLSFRHAQMLVYYTIAGVCIYLLLLVFSSIISDISVWIGESNENIAQIVDHEVDHFSDTLTSSQINNLKKEKISFYRIRKHSPVCIDVDQKLFLVPISHDSVVILNKQIKSGRERLNHITGKKPFHDRSVLKVFSDFLYKGKELAVKSNDNYNNYQLLCPGKEGKLLFKVPMDIYKYDIYSYKSSPIVVMVGDSLSSINKSIKNKLFIYSPSYDTVSTISIDGYELNEAFLFDEENEKFPLYLYTQDEFSDTSLKRIKGLILLHYKPLQEDNNENRLVYEDDNRLTFIFDLDQCQLYPLNESKCSI